MTEPSREDIAVLRKLRDGNGIIERPTDEELYALERLAQAGLANFAVTDDNPEVDLGRPDRGWVRVRATIPLKGHAALLAHDPEIQ
jgi:hypothetical protein